MSSPLSRFRSSVKPLSFGLGGLRCAHFLCALFVLVILGCNNDPIGKTVPVSGKVTVAGKALTTGSIVFWPDSDKGNTSAFEALGEITSTGTYELMTRGKAGAPPGAYKVTVSAQEPSNPNDRYSKPRLLVPAEVTRKESTPLRFEVVEGGAAGTYDIVLSK